MKIRTNFVSNSSSSSFIISIKNEDDALAYCGDTKSYINLTEYYNLREPSEEYGGSFIFNYIPYSKEDIEGRVNSYLTYINKYNTNSNAEFKFKIDEMKRKIIKELIELVFKKINEEKISYFLFKDFRDSIKNDMSEFKKILKDKYEEYSNQIEEYCYFQSVIKQHLFSILNELFKYTILNLIISLAWSLKTGEIFQEIVVPYDGGLDENDKISEWIDQDDSWNYEANFEVVEVW